jgi:hypothetical protein
MHLDWITYWQNTYDSCDCLANSCPVADLAPTPSLSDITHDWDMHRWHNAGMRNTRLATTKPNTAIVIFVRATTFILILFLYFKVLTVLQVM